jgi:hypothetical protein
MRVTIEQKGKFNKDYWSVIFWFDEADKHFFHRRDKGQCNWMPKHEEISRILRGCIEVEPLAKRQHLAATWKRVIDESLDLPTNYNK